MTRVYIVCMLFEVVLDEGWTGKRGDIYVKDLDTSNMLRNDTMIHCRELRATSKTPSHLDCFSLVSGPAWSFAFQCIFAARSTSNIETLFQE
jgi:hypothetical protein